MDIKGMTCDHCATSIAKVLDKEGILEKNVSFRKGSADVKVRSFRGKIQSLQKIEKALTKLSDECYGANPQGDYAILEALETVGEA